MPFDLLPVPGLSAAAAAAAHGAPFLDIYSRRRSAPVVAARQLAIYLQHVALGASLEENLEAIGQSVAAVVASGREALLDCEHFFDGYKA
ncbi:MAG: citramalate synthase, partial [Methylocystis sp.]|nr:citramalate synthase [Methylocystis sp.]